MNLRKLISNIPMLLMVARKIRSHIRKINARKKWRSLQTAQCIKLELGSGMKFGDNGWTTIDLNGADITWDLSRGFPLRNSCVDKIYSSHLLEHIPFDDLIPILRECHRVMKENGEFSVCVPNFRLYAKAYLEGQLYVPRCRWWQPGAINTGSCIDQINYLAYMRDQHRYMFDEENLVNTLIQAGFSRVKLREFDQEIDPNERKFESIYAIALK